MRQGKGVRIQALQKAMQDIAGMHNIELTRPMGTHNFSAEMCACSRGAAIRTLRIMLKNVMEE